MMGAIMTSSGCLPRVLLPLGFVAALPACTQSTGSAPYGICSAELTQHRALSAPIWQAGHKAQGVGRDFASSERRWAEAKANTQPDHRDISGLMIFLYWDYKNYAKPKFSPYVTPEAINALGSAIRCIKDAYRATGKVRPNDKTDGLDKFIRKESKQKFGVAIDLGDPL